MFACPAFVITAIGFEPDAASLVIAVCRRSWNARTLRLDPPQRRERPSRCFPTASPEYGRPVSKLAETQRPRSERYGVRCQWASRASTSLRESAIATGRHPRTWSRGRASTRVSTSTSAHRSAYSSKRRTPAQRTSVRNIHVRHPDRRSRSPPSLHLSPVLPGFASGCGAASAVPRGSPGSSRSSSARDRAVEGVDEHVDIKRLTVDGCSYSSRASPYVRRDVPRPSATQPGSPEKGFSRRTGPPSVTSRSVLRLPITPPCAASSIHVSAYSPQSDRLRLAGTPSAPPEQAAPATQSQPASA